nr:RNA-binding protein 42 [Ipomoea batatas]GME19918.1 RNA-binding protein 42 [Ipomoea batatas]
MSSVPSTSAAAASSSSQYTYSNGTYFPTPFHLQQQPSQPYIGAAPPPAQLPAPPAVPAVYPPPAPLPGVYSLPQYQQAQQLFQRDAQTITPEALENVKAALASSDIEHKVEAKKKALPRKAAGQSWEDPTLADWPENDYRLFCGDLGNEVNDDVLSKAFSRFPSFNMARVVRDKRTGKTKGYGFVSFSNPLDLAAALKEMNGKYVGNRPIKLRKSKWQDRIDNDALERQKNHSQKKGKMPRKSVLHK